jgi:hypothetical protein
MKSRPPIPPGIKRLLRQEAGFGCCKCGRPIIEYHHIIPYSEEAPHFRPQDLMCLCPYCHHEATLGAMSEEEQRELKLNPVNILNNKAQGYLKINQTSLILSLGTIQFVTDNEVITMDDKDLISIKINESGRIDISLLLYDEQNVKILEIIDNEWISGDYIPWDIESSFQWLIIRHRKYKILLAISAKSFPVSILGELWYNRTNFSIKPSGVQINNEYVSMGISNLCFVGGNIKVDTLKRSISIQPHKVYGSSSLISEPNLEKRIQNGIASFEQLKKQFKN